MRVYLSICTILILTGIEKKSFAQLPSFNSYKVDLFTGRPAKLIIKGNALAEMYKTIITDSYHNESYMRKWHGTGGLNFAGHYCFLYWGCGSDCQHGAIVDLHTGKVYDGPTASSLFEYKPWSRLVIVNRPGDNDCAFCRPEYWVLNESTKRFEKIK